MSKHYQFETTMTMTGSNSDVRVPVTPSEEAHVALAIHAQIVGGSAVSINEEVDARVKEAANDLLANRGEGLLVSGSNDPNVQMVVNAVNDALGNYGSTIDIDTPANLWNGDDAAMEQLVQTLVRPEMVGERAIERGLGVLEGVPSDLFAVPETGGAVILDAQGQPVYRASYRLVDVSGHSGKSR